jgi:hypothetical protein
MISSLFLLIIVVTILSGCNLIMFLIAKFITILYVYGVICMYNCQSISLWIIY